MYDILLRVNIFTQWLSFTRTYGLNDESSDDGFDFPNLRGELAFFGDEYSVRVESTKIFLFGARFAVLIPVTCAFVNVYSILNFPTYNIAHKYISYHKLIA